MPQYTQAVVPLASLRVWVGDWLELRQQQSQTCTNLGGKNPNNDFDFNSR